MDTGSNHVNQEAQLVHHRKDMNLCWFILFKCIIEFSQFHKSNTRLTNLASSFPD